MRNWLSNLCLASVAVCGICTHLAAYDDDDLLCRPGWSPELLQQQIADQQHQHRMNVVQSQQAMLYAAAAEQRGLELSKRARAARADREAKRREQIIADRKANLAAKENAGIGAKLVANDRR